MEQDEAEKEKAEGVSVAEENQIDIDGVVLTRKSTKAWLDDFRDWLESRKERFRGGCVGDGEKPGGEM